MVVQSYSPSTREAEARESRVQGQPVLYIGFQTAYATRRLCPKMKKKIK